jgi:sulfatase modifying factor 1
MRQDLKNFVLSKTQVEERALLQAKELNSTIDLEANSFISHHIHQEIGWVGGQINFPLKIDMLFKTYHPELAAYIFLRFPEDAKHRAFDLLRSMDSRWSPFAVEGNIVDPTSSVERAAEAIVCILSIMDPSEATRIASGLTSGTITMVKAAYERIQRKYKAQTSKPSAVLVKAEMVFIEAGEFIMGTSSEQAKLIVKKIGNWQLSWFEREMPQRAVYLDGYWIDKYPVTNSIYKAFIDATGHPVPWQNTPLSRPYNWDKSTNSYPQGRADHPVVLVDWYDACAYAKWAGKRLPTEAEWEKVARGTDGRIWPWGNEWDPAMCSHGMGISRGTTPVTAFEKGVSPYGVVDMAGNVWEWTADGFDSAYHRNSSRSNPQGSGINKVIRGGCFYDETPELYRCAVRDGVGPDVWEMYRGFRCVKDVK